MLCMNGGGLQSYILQAQQTVVVGNSIYFETSYLKPSDYDLDIRLGRMVKALLGELVHHSRLSTQYVPFHRSHSEHGK